MSEQFTLVTEIHRLRAELAKALGLNIEDGDA